MIDRRIHLAEGESRCRPPGTVYALCARGAADVGLSPLRQWWVETPSIGCCARCPGFVNRETLKPAEPVRRVNKAIGSEA